MTDKPLTPASSSALMREKIASFWVNDWRYSGTPSHRGEGETDAEYRLTVDGVGDFVIRFNIFDGEWELARYEDDESQPPFAGGTLAEMAEMAEGIIQNAVESVFRIFAPTSLS